MSVLFLDSVPEKITSKTLLVDIFDSAYAFKAIQNRCVTVGNIVKAVKNGQLEGIIENQSDREAFESWLKVKGLLRNRKKSGAEERPYFPPNPKIKPLERIHLEAGLDGRSGPNRGDSAMQSLEALDDLSAINAWINARAGNPNTQGVYRKEAERFLLWCTVEKDIAMSAVGVAEASDYLRWLEELGRLDEKVWAKHWKCPQHNWIGTKNTPRDNENWRPFNGALSHTSRKMSVTVVRQLFNFLKKTGYIVYNPFDQISTKVPYLEGEGAPKAFADRSFTESQWQTIYDYFESQDDDERHARMAVVLMLGKGLGLRASEMLQARASWIVERRIDTETITVIEVVGKGDKIRRLPLQQEQVSLINHYLSMRGLPHLGLVDPDTPLLASLGRGRQNSLKTGQAKRTALSRSGLYLALEDFLEAVALHVENERPLDAAKFRASSTHWLRHTFATTALKEMPVNVVQNAMGHASVGTTSRYLTPEESEVARAMRKLKAF